MTANHQAQHIVPEAVFGRFAQRIADWTNGEFKLNGGYNLIELPNNTDVARSTGYVRHNGGIMAAIRDIQLSLQEYWVRSMLKTLLTWKKVSCFKGFLRFCAKGKE